MAPRFKIRDTDRGFARLMRQLRGGFAERLAVGVLARTGSKRHPDGKINVAGLAMVHEYGSGSIPERSFIRSWADEKRAENMERIRRVARAVISRTGREERELREIGKEMVAEIRQRIADGLEPPLAPSTARRKGSSAPLIKASTGTGALIRAIAAEVRGPNRGAR